ncbi:MAG TPA: DUF692 domain-containing protein [Polyangium sp.]|nr:DUF692 domain-containing protein [Polyangium sp.]
MPDSTSFPLPSPPFQGVGLGLRWEFIEEIAARLDDPEIQARIPFFEVPPENYLRRGGFYFDALVRVHERFPLLTHGLTLSVGATDAFDIDYFADLRMFLQRVKTPFHSDHLCFSGHNGRMFHELLPLPLNRAAATHTAQRLVEAQDRLGLPLLMENITHYFIPGRAAMLETDFIGEILEAANAWLLLDVNNIYVNSLNYGFDAFQFLQKMPLARTKAIHVAGHEWRADDEAWIDTHGADVEDPVLALLEWTIAQTGPLPVILERDHHIPPLETLLVEMNRIDAAYQRGLRGFHERR